MHLWPENKCYLDNIFFFFLDKHLIWFLCERFRENNFLKLLGALRWAGGVSAVVPSVPATAIVLQGYQPKHLWCSGRGSPALSSDCSVACWAQGAHPTGSRAQIVHRLLLFSLCRLFFFPKCSFIFLINFFCHLWVRHKWQKKNSLLLSPPCSGGRF